MGQLGASLGNPNVTDPRQARPQDLSGSEMGARFLAQGTRGLANGFQNYQQQNSQIRNGGGGGGGMIQAPQAQSVSPDYFLPRGNNLNFYGQS